MEQKAIPERVYLKDKIYAQILLDIESGKFKPGDYITELALTHEYDVSRTTIREALSRLLYEDFIIQFRKGGYLIKEISYKELFELLDLRLLLEPHATRLAVDKITDSDLEVLRKDSIYGTLAEWYEKNLEFHLTIARASGNSKLADMIGQVLEQGRRFYILESANLFPLDDENEHTYIYRALASRNTDEAVRLVEEHLLNSRNRLKLLVQKKLF